VLQLPPIVGQKRHDGVQKMMGHTSLKTITDKYFSYVPNMTHNDGSKFMEEYARAGEKRGPNVAHFQGHI
jgi:hypothetical protein